MSKRRLKTDGRGLLFPSNSLVGDVAADPDGIAFCAVQTPTKDTSLRGIAAFRHNLRATPLRLESLVGWIAATVFLVLAVQIFG